MTQIIAINKDTLKRCCKNQKIQHSVALSLCIKREHGNSVIYDYTLDKLMKRAHGAHSVIKNALEHSIENGFVTKQAIQKKDGIHTNLKANKFDGDNSCSIKLGIAINKSGYKILYIFGKTNKNIAESRTDPQSFKEVCDLISEAWIMLGLERQKVILNTIKRVKENTSILQESSVESEFIDTGISYDGIRKFFTDGFYSRKQIIRLIKDMRDKGLITWRHCSIQLFDRNPNSCSDQNYYADFKQIVFDGIYNWINRKTGEVVKWIHHSYWGKGNNIDIRYRPLCNQYTILSPAISYIRHYRKPMMP